MKSDAIKTLQEEGFVFLEEEVSNKQPALEIEINKISSDEANSIATQVAKLDQAHKDEKWKEYLWLMHQQINNMDMAFLLPKISLTTELNKQTGPKNPPTPLGSSLYPSQCGSKFFDSNLYPSKLGGDGDDDSKLNDESLEQYSKCRSK